MSARLILRSPAERDIERILDWYLKHSPEHAVGFIENLEEGIGHLLDSPRIFRTVYGDVRRMAMAMAMRRFPYFLWFIYFDEANVVQIVAVTHQRHAPIA